MSPRQLLLQTGTYFVPSRVLGMGSWHSKSYLGEADDFGTVVLKIVPWTPVADEREKQAKYVRYEQWCGGEIHCDSIRSMHESGDLPNIPEWGCDEGGAYMLFEYMPYTVDQLLRSGPFEPANVLALANRLASALEQIHRRATPIVHRDVKPNNIGLQSSSCDSAKLMDFSIARAEGSTGVTSRGATGTVAYMAPEQMIDSSSVGPATDVYALGLVLWECLVGEVPMSRGDFHGTLAARQACDLPKLVVGGMECETLCDEFRTLFRSDAADRSDAARFVERFRKAGEVDGLFPSQAMRAGRVVEDFRHKGGCLWVYRSREYGELLKQKLPETQWHYSEKRGGWFTKARDADAQALRALVGEAPPRPYSTNVSPRRKAR